MTTAVVLRQEAPPADVTTLGRRVQRGIVVGLFVALGAVVGTGALAAYSLHRLTHAERWVDHTYDVLDALSRVSTHLAEADAGARAYALSGQPEFLSVYRIARARLGADVALAHRLTADNAVQVRRLAALDSVLAVKLAVVDSIAYVATSGGGRAARLPAAPAAALRVRALLEQMRAEESRLLGERQAQARAQAAHAERLVIAGTGVSLATAALVTLMVLYVLRLRQQALADVEAGARRLRLAFGTTGTLGWDRDLRTNVITSTAGAAEHDSTETVADFLAQVHPDDREYAEAAVEQAVRGVVDYDVEFRLVTALGERWVASRAGVLRDASGRAVRLVGVCTDITARKLAQWREEELARAEQSRVLAEAGADRYRRLAEELRASTERYRALVSASSEVVFRASPDGVEFVAPRWCELTGQAPGEIHHGGWALAIDAADRAQVVALWQERLAARAPFEGEYRLRHHDGAVRWMHMRAVPLLGPDREVREWVGAIADVDDRRRAHDGLVAAQAELAERVASRTQELEEANLVLRAMIAQRVHADAALRASEARFRAATEGGLDSFYLLKTVRAGATRRGRIADFEFVDCNARGAALVGATREGLVGQKLCELFPSYLTDGLFDRYVQVAETGQALEEEIEVAEPGIKARWLRVQVVPVNDGIAITSRDISERRQVESALMESERRFRDLLGNVRLVAVALDTAGRVTFCNAALLELTGLERDALMGADWFTACGVDSEDGSLRALFEAAVPAGELPSHFESALVDRAGERRVIAWDNTVLRDAAGQVIGFASLGADITDQKRYERGLRESKEAAELARLRAEDASRAKSEFLARMSHELRTPLNSVIGFSTVLLRNTAKTLSAQDVMCVERINASGRHLLGVINDILDIAKVEAGRMTLEIAPVSVNALIRTTVEQFEASLADRDVRLALELPPDEHGISTDAAKLQQVLLNLVGNAIKFTEHGTVTVRVTTDPATARPTRIDVADTGVGIPPERLGAIFDAFEQADTSTTRRFGGTGLGLAISRSLCELMGYELQVESAVGQGSTFSVVLAA